MNRKRDGVNTNEVFAKTTLKISTIKSILKTYLAKKDFILRTFFASTQKHSNNSFNSDYFM